MEPKVVHCKKESFDIYIGRPSKWGNPFIIGKDGNREEVIERYRCWIKKQLNLLNQLNELKNKILGCWCSPNRCHGEVLLQYANYPGCRDKIICPTCKKEYTSTTCFCNQIIKCECGFKLCG